MTHFTVIRKLPDTLNSDLPVVSVLQHRTEQVLFFCVDHHNPPFFRLPLFHNLQNPCRCGMTQF